MNFWFVKNLPLLGFHLNLDLVKPVDAKKSSVSTLVTDPPLPQSKDVLGYAFEQLWERWFLQSIFPWGFKGGAANDKIQVPPPPTPGMKESKYTKALRGTRSESGCALPLFRPYVARVPWHKGARAFLSQLFPRYGHYCGPNWSSGKDNGLLLWDRRPIDSLDFCCYCHDIGYDTHDQAKLLKADIAFLECLERSQASSTKGDAHVAHLYRLICIAGLKNILIPYRRQLVRMQQEQLPLVERIRADLNRNSRTCRHT